MDQKVELKGLRCILVVRCSTDQQIDTSIEKQIEMGKDFIVKNEMVLVDIEEFPGYSASLGLHHEKMYKLLDRRRQNCDFEALLFMAYDRFCRRGTTEGNRIAEDFEEAGISIVTIKEGLISGKFAWLQRGMYLHQAQSFVSDMSYHVSTGWSKALNAGIITHTGRMPYGVDKLYVDAKGGSLYVLHDLPNGTRVKLDPNTRKPIESYPKGTRGPKRQPSERIVCVMGDPKQVETVRQIFRRHYIDGWGQYRIAKELNDKGVPAKYGGNWTKNSVRGTWLNPIYLGYGYTNTRICGIYHCRGASGPIEHSQPRKRRMKKDGSGMCRNVQPIPRPKHEWLRVDQPLLRNYLDEDLRKVVLDTMKRNDETGGRNGRKRGGDRHIDSTFILKGILWEKNFGCLMAGNDPNPSKKSWRGYKVNRVTHRPSSLGPKAHQINANLIERAVLSVLDQVLPSEELIAGRIAKFLDQEQRTIAAAMAQLKAMEAEKAEVAAQLRNIYSSGPHCQELMADELQRCEKRLEEIDRNKARTQTAGMLPKPDTSEVVNRVLKQLKEVLALRWRLPAQHLRRLISVFVPRVIFDCFTEEVEIQVLLPQWALAEERAIQHALRLVTVSSDTCSRQHHGENGANLAFFGGKVDRSCRPIILKLSPIDSPAYALGQNTLPQVTVNGAGELVAVKHTGR